MSALDIRILGAMLEKERTTPEGYPLSTNALILACNQKTSRLPVTDYSLREVEEALQGLRRVCADVRFLGSYPRHRWAEAAGERPVPAPAGLSDVDYADAAAWLARLRTGELT